MSFSITGSSLVLGDDKGASEVVFDLNFREMANQSLSAGVNTLSDGTKIFVTLVDSPPWASIVNGQGLSARCLTNDQVIVSLDLTGAINAGKTATDPGRFNPRDRLRMIAEISGTTISGAGANGDGFYSTIGNGISTEVGTGDFSGTPISTEAVFAAIHVDSNNGNKLTPRIWSRIGGTYAEKDYTGVDERVVTPGVTHVVLETDIFEGSCWTRYKTGSTSLDPHVGGLPVPTELTTYGRARLLASGAVVVDNSPFTGSVIGNLTFWAPVTEVSASLTRLTLLRYGNIK